jgi:GntR family transcriptional regulator/MocR family aminotransferase
MAKTTCASDLALGTRRPSETLAEWLYRELCDAIVAGRLAPNSRLPSTRTLAAQFEISRGTVIGVFEQLTAHGYVESRVGAGSSVVAKVPDERCRVERDGLAPVEPGVLAAISKRGAVMVTSPFPLRRASSRPPAFRANQPALDEFPISIWSKLVAKRMRLASRQTLLAGDVPGLRQLREAIAVHLGSTRGIVCTADQIVILSGTQQALDLVARLVLDPGDEVWMEDPGYPGARAILSAAGAKLVPVPIDESGLAVEVGTRLAPNARLAYVTPAHQFPLGVKLSSARRAALLEWSRARGAWIFEDDYDSEFRFVGRPIAAMQGLDPTGNVIFSGSFNKTLFPSLRLSFVVVPTRLVDSFCGARSIVDRYPRALDQLVLCDFIEGQHFARYLRRVRELYQERLDVLLELASSQWGDSLRVAGTETGLQTVAWLGPGWTDRTFATMAYEQGVEVVPLSNYALESRPTSGLHIGFGAVSPSEIRRAGAILTALLHRGAQASRR